MSRSSTRQGAKAGELGAAWLGEAAKGIQGLWNSNGQWGEEGKWEQSLCGDFEVLVEKGECIWEISGAERSGAQLCMSESVGALQHGEWQDWGGGQVSRRGRCSLSGWQGGVQSKVELSVLRDLFQCN